MSDTADAPSSISLAELTAEIISAYVSNNPMRPSDLPILISVVHQALLGMGQEQKTLEPAEALKPAVPIKKSITPDYLISLENGQKFRSLRRHLMTSYGMTADEYRAKWGLPADYPMVAPNYAAQRSELAKNMGLGRKAKAEAAAAQPAPKKSGRKSKAVGNKS